MSGAILRRRWQSALGWALAALAGMLLVGVLLHIMLFVLMRGGGALSLEMLLTDTQGVAGGLRNAITGSLLLSGLGLALGVPIGVGSGIYLAERRGSLNARVLSLVVDVLVGVPSIVLGYFGYVTLVLHLGWGFSLAAGALTLALLMLPYIARSTDLALRNLPPSLRESAYALGCGEGRLVMRILLPAAAGPIFTGILLAFAIGLGETAPLIYTADWSNYLWNRKFSHEPVGYLTYVIWSFIQEPFASAHQLAYAAALIIMLMVFALALGARLVLLRRYAPAA